MSTRCIINIHRGISRIMPLFTMIALFTLLFCYSNEKRVQVVYLFLAAGLIMMNFLVMGLMQDILVKGELLRESALTDQKFHAAREQGVSMIFKVGDMSGIRLDGEESRHKH